ncbi:MAG: hypothetical protein QOH34_2820, partial [Mycobacterium sp.]|nr:hypothetical protein [Mycobacterium sp.]
MDTRNDAARRGLSRRVGALVDTFETVIYAIAFLLLVSAAVLVVIGGAEAVVQAASHKVNTLQGGVLVLDRVLMVLIIAEIAATLRAVRGPVSAEVHTLGQRQFAGVVDGVGGTAHIGLPGVRTGLAAAAGLLFTAEGAADLGARG